MKNHSPCCHKNLLVVGFGQKPKKCIKPGRRMLALKHRVLWVCCQCADQPWGSCISRGSFCISHTPATVLRRVGTAAKNLSFQSTASCFPDSCKYTQRHHLWTLPWNSVQKTFDTRRHSNTLCLVLVWEQMKQRTVSFKYDFFLSKWKFSLQLTNKIPPQIFIF